jgi:hypothetical protein
VGISMILVIVLSESLHTWIFVGVTGMSVVVTVVMFAVVETAS